MSQLPNTSLHREPEAEPEGPTRASLFQRFGLLVILGSMILGIGISTYNGLSNTTSRAPRIIRPQGNFSTLTLTISLFVLVDDIDNPDPTISSRRTEEELLEILNGINEIWAQANIHFEAQTVSTIEVPADVLRPMTVFIFDPFFDQIGRTFQVPRTAHINAYFVRSIGGPNGVKPNRQPAFFVMDNPSVHDQRVSSHEIGHFLGLGHTASSAGRLMFSGTNGMLLSDNEILIARQVAQHILNAGQQQAALTLLAQTSS